MYTYKNEYKNRLNRFKYFKYRSLAFWAIKQYISNDRYCPIRR